MGDVLVRGGKVADGAITELKIEMHGLGERTIDRDTALGWMKDGHSFIPMVGGVRAPALLLLEVGDALFIRDSAAPEASDSLPSFG